MLFASDSRSDSAHDVGTVETVDPVTGIITLSDAVNRANGFATTDTLTPKEASLAIEVAGLNRNVIFTAQSDDVINLTHGGHMIIFHTSRPQIIQGVEFANMGQDGNLGRYPVHFHKCHESGGAVVSKNVVKGSSQRW